MTLWDLESGEPKTTSYAAETRVVSGADFCAVAQVAKSSEWLESYSTTPTMKTHMTLPHNPNPI
jgi:hypothetical protein